MFLRAVLGENAVGAGRVANLRAPHGQSLRAMDSGDAG